MNILAIANNKGGVGKTTSSQNIGAVIEKFSHKRVLMIDLDSQGSLSNGFGIHLKPGDPHIGHFLLRKKNWKKLLKSIKTPI